VPGASDPGVALTVRDAGEDGVAVPLADEMESQVLPEEVVALAVKESELPPELETCNCCVRAPLPWVAVKLTFWLSTASFADALR
jgi:hypothetical protein